MIDLNDRPLLNNYIAHLQNQLALVNVGEVYTALGVGCYLLIVILPFASSVRCLQAYAFGRYVCDRFMQRNNMWTIHCRQPLQ